MGIFRGAERPRQQDGDGKSHTDREGGIVTVRKQGNKYVLKSSSGRTLGTHRSKKAAQKQERAIKASQARRNK
jgi:hypothetical protein